MRPIAFLTRELLPVSLAAAILAAPLGLPARAQQNVAAPDAAPPMPAPAPMPAPMPEALDIGDCPDTGIGFEKGSVYRCYCAASTGTGPVYGSDLYTDDSHICTAAVHAGALKRGGDGALLIQVDASPRVFKGLTRNGVKSEVWLKPSTSAFAFVPHSP